MNVARVSVALLLLIVLIGCKGQPTIPATITIHELEIPPWPCKAAGKGPSFIAVSAEKETVIEICPVDPWKCEAHTVQAGDWVIEVDVPADEIWHVRIY